MGRTLTIDDVDYTVEPADMESRLLRYMRHKLNLSVVKEGCSQGFCGACVLLFQRVPGAAWATANSCMLTVAQATAFHALRTARHPSLGAARRAVKDHAASQCGFCTPGQVCNLYTMPSAETGRMDGNVCRCTGYGPLVECARAVCADPPDIEDIVPGSTTQRAHALASLDDVRAAYVASGSAIVAGGQSRFIASVDGPPVGATVLDIRFVQELREIVSRDDGMIRVGGAATLSELAAVAPNGLRSHIERMATHHVRNTGTLVGNLVLAKRHGLNFDSVPMLAATAARVRVEDLATGVIRDWAFDRFWAGAWSPSFLVHHISMTACDTYVAHRDARRSRACGADAIVCTTDAASGPYFCMYGGTLHTATSSVPLDSDPPALRRCRARIRKMQLGLPSYAALPRVPTTTVLEQGAPVHYDATAPKKYEMDAQVVGDPIYTADVPLPPGATHCAYVQATSRGILVDVGAPQPCASTVVSSPADGLAIDYDDWKDTPFSETVMVPVGQRAAYVGQPIAIVVAPTLEQARADARRFRPVYDEADEGPAARSGTVETARTVGPPGWLRGAQAAICQAYRLGGVRTVSGECTTGSQKHLYLEPQSVVCLPGPLDTWDIHVSSQNNDSVQAVAAQVLGVPVSRVRVHTASVGGAFGGKLDRHLPHVAMACLAARRSRRPTSNVVLSAQDLAMTGGRPSMRAAYRATYSTRTHRLTELECTVTLDGGVPGPFASFLAHACHELLTQWYGVIRADVRVDVVATAECSRTTVRAPGALESLYIMEHVMDHVASQCGIDPIELRDRNLVRYPGWGWFGTLSRGFGTGFRVNEHADLRTLRAFWDAARRRHAELQPEVDAFNRDHAGTKRRAISLTPSFFTSARRPATARVSILPDGSLQVSVDGMEIGQGLRTKLKEAVVRAVVMAFPFGASRDEISDRVRVLGNDTATCPNPHPTGGNTSTESACIAATLATWRLVWWMAFWAYCLWVYGLVGWALRAGMRALASFAYANVDVLAESAEAATWWQRAARVMCRTPYISPTSACSTPAAVYATSPRGILIHTQGVALHVVELDTIAGEVDVVRAELWADTGDGIHKQTDVGQIQGAYTMGLGAVLLEDERSGAHTDWWTYKPPLATDCPRDTVIHLRTRKPSPFFWRSYKSVGEPPLMGAVGIVSAIRYCLQSVRNGEFVPLPLPITPRSVFERLARTPAQTHG